MTLEQIRAAKSAAEADILQSVQQRLSDFHKATGMCPRGISLRTITYSNDAEIVVCGVSIELEAI